MFIMFVCAFHAYLGVVGAATRRNRAESIDVRPAYVQQRLALLDGVPGAQRLAAVDPVHQRTRRGTL